MVFVLLCGGLGTRMTQGTLPKPLTPLLGSPSLKFALEHIAPLVPELIFIYARHLAAYNFEETVINLFKGTKCIFTCVPFATRGAVETALAGLLQLALPLDLPLVFLDNDNVYPASLATLAAPATPFLGFGEDTSELASFSFMRRDACGRVLEFVEKRRISNEVCNGVYGFSSAAQFLHWARHTLRHGPFPKGEIYMSSLFVNMIAAGERVNSAPVPVVQLGTAAFAAAFLEARPEKLRICFDLDNTLVTYPRVPGDYSTVAPVEATVAIARWARAAGHTVIVHTARRMATHGHNVGRVTADIGRVTFDTLDKFGIPYDEIIFGKPIADVYIDDRAVNPFFNTVRAMGLPFGSEGDAVAPALANALPNNKYNALRVVEGRVVKRGPEASMRGEAFFYEAARKLAIARHFPAFHGRELVPAPAASGGGALPPPGAQLDITMDAIKGVPLTTMMRAQLLADYHLEAALAALRELHACADVPVTLPLDVLRGSYAHKLRARLSDAGVYGTFPDARAVLADIEVRLSRHTAGASFAAASVIHGDAWFANILLTPTNELRFIDMRGQVSGELTLNGDAYADWAKLCQSVLGFDEVVFGLPRAPHAYRAGLLRGLAASLKGAGADTRAVLDVCICLVAGSLHAYDDGAVRGGLWALASSALNPSGNKEWEELVGIMGGDLRGPK